MSLFRALVSAAAVIGGGVTFARRKLDVEIQKKVNARIEEARDAAIAELRAEVDRLVSEQFLTFADSGPEGGTPSQEGPGCAPPRPRPGTMRPMNRPCACYYACHQTATRAHDLFY